MDSTNKRCTSGERNARRFELIQARGGYAAVAAAALQDGVSSDRIAAAFRKRHPRAWPDFADTVAFHLAVDGVEALRDLLVGLRLTHETGEWHVEPGDVIHMMYHFYNCQLIMTLTERIDGGLAPHLDEIDDALGDGDIEEARHALASLRDYLRAKENPPDIG